VHPRQAPWEKHFFVVVRFTMADQEKNGHSTTFMWVYACV
jgi:hypothetical protein